MPHRRDRRRPALTTPVRPDYARWVVAVTDVRRLPVPVTETWEWQLRAACRDLDTAMFFHPEAERGTAKRARDTAAKRVCAGCPVIEDCRRHALAVQEPYGVWGGLTAGEREEILHPGRGERRRTPILSRGPITSRESAGTSPGQ